MATMPSRSETAPRAIASILPQVEQLWLFLDRFDSIPTYADDERVRVVRSQDVGDLRASGKLLGLALQEQPCTYFAVDDDVDYPADYCDVLTAHVDRFSGRAAAGVHACLFREPMTSYVNDMKVLHRRSEQGRAVGVDLLGSDSLAFYTGTLRFDVREWRDVNVVDLAFALEARRRAVPLVMIPRRSHWLTALDENQDDSIWMSVVRDDGRQTELAREVMSLPRPPLPRVRLRRLTYRDA